MSRGKGGWVYLMTNKNKTTLYVGVTSDLRSRVYQHKNHVYKTSFSHRYNLEYCIYYEPFHSIVEAIAREKQVKKWGKRKKTILINSMNPEWNDLWEEIDSW
jgi:putative endonuclease